MSQHYTLTIEPCAFCGKSHTPKIVLASEHWADEYDGYYPHSESYAVMCDASSPNGPGGCGASGGFKATEADAIAVWNRRAALSATQPAQAALPVQNWREPHPPSRLCMCPSCIPSFDERFVPAQAAQGEPVQGVPKLTGEMVNAAHQYLNRFKHWPGLPDQFRWHELWAAMLDASPTPPAQQGETT